MLSAQYNSPVRQTHILDYLESLSVDSFVASGLCELGALAKVYSKIVRMSSQLPASHRGNAHRIWFMRRSVLNKTWLHPALQRVASSGLSY